MCIYEQSGTEDDEEFEGVSKAIDGYVVMSGYTYGTWSATNAGSMDFVATLMDANANRPWEYQVRSKLVPGENV